MACTQVTFDEHSSQLVTFMYDLYRRQQLTDVVLVAEGREFSVHVMVLAAYSTRFRKMVDSGCIFHSGLQHHIKNVRAESLSLVIDFLYTGSIQLNPLVVFQLLLAANKLEIQSLVNVCQEYVVQEQPLATTGLSLADGKNLYRGKPREARHLGPQQGEDVNHLDGHSEEAADILPASIKEEAIKTEVEDYSDGMAPLDDSSCDFEVRVTNFHPSWQSGVTMTSKGHCRKNTRRQKASSNKSGQRRAGTETTRAKKSSAERVRKYRLKQKMRKLQKVKKLRWSLQEYLARQKDFRARFGIRLILRTWALDFVQLRYCLQKGPTPEARFQCQICKKSFQVYSLYRRHFSLCHGKAYTCVGCPKTFSTRLKTRRHQSACVWHRRLRRQQSRRRKTCLAEGCGRPFLHPHNLHVHRRKEHPKERNRQPKVTTTAIPADRKCEECSFTAPGVRPLLRHMKLEHPSLIYQCTKGDNATKRCWFTTPLRELMEKHVKLRHSVHKRSILCEMCDAILLRPSELRLHQYTKHGIKHPDLTEFKCDFEDCGYTTFNKTNMSAHRRTHFPRQMFTCEQCGRSVNSEKSLERHFLRMHVHGKCFICTQCGASYGSKSELTHHENVHVRGKTFVCDICDYRTDLQMQLRRHQYLLHKVKFDPRVLKTFECSLCPARFTQQSKYRIHMNVHMNIKEVECDICHKMFTSSSLMKGHKRATHAEKTQQCGYCDFRCTLKSKLKTHERIMHTARGYKPYKCYYCDFHCATSGNCRKHVMQRHKGKEVKVIKVAAAAPEAPSQAAAGESEVQT